MRGAPRGGAGRRAAAIGAGLDCAGVRGQGGGHRGAPRSRGGRRVHCAPTSSADVTPGRIPPASDLSSLHGRFRSFHRAGMQGTRCRAFDPRLPPRREPLAPSRPLAHIAAKTVTRTDPRGHGHPRSRPARGEREVVRDRLPGVRIETTGAQHGVRQRRRPMDGEHERSRGAFARTPVSPGLSWRSRGSPTRRCRLGRRTGPRSIRDRRRS